MAFKLYKQQNYEEETNKFLKLIGCQGFLMIHSSLIYNRSGKTEKFFDINKKNLL